VRSEQRKLRLAVVESIHVGPRPGVVASFAPKRRAVRPMPRHAVIELPMMRVFMTSGATAIFKAERQNLIRAVRHLRLVAIVAGNSRVRARKGVSRFAMFCDGIERAVKIPNGVAVFTTIIVRRTSELSVVHVFMAIDAIREFHLVNRVLASR